VEVEVGGGDGGERRGRTVPVGAENGVGERKGFSAAVTVGRGDHAAGFGGGSRRRCRWRENLGARCRWRENGGGGGGIFGGLRLIFFFFLKQKRRGTCHITFVITVESRRLFKYHYSKN
jgi:hypothetical protein